MPVVVSLCCMPPAKRQQACSWQLVRGEEATDLQLSCQAPGEGGSEGLRCVYRGQPERCAAYSAKSRQYWKQILGKLRRKRHPCLDSSPLKARPAAPGATSSGAHAGAPEKRGKAGKRKGGPGSPVPPEQPPPTAGGNPEPPTELSEDLAETYCAEQWHSLCSFFVNFWNG
uniref:Fibroblast growth factor binding protein 3 n=1 Tax=Chelydra serpentina TaxID=8475 RepID=A0A8C3RS59_CHESE